MTTGPQNFAPPPKKSFKIVYIRPPYASSKLEKFNNEGDKRFIQPKKSDKLSFFKFSFSAVKNTSVREENTKACLI